MFVSCFLGWLYNSVVCVCYYLLLLVVCYFAVCCVLLFG